LPNNINADFALTLALPISFKSKRNSKEVAQEIIKNFDYSSCELTITEQGYINFRFPTTYYQNYL
jgi:arginyl-tRNA synthetase